MQTQKQNEQSARGTGVVKVILEDTGVQFVLVNFSSSRKNVTGKDKKEQSGRRGNTTRGSKKKTK